MPAHPPRAAPPPERDRPIAPQQLWGYLSTRQQQQVRQVLIGVAQQVMTHLPCPTLTEEAPDES
jgi:hypothetical protein